MSSPDTPPANVLEARGLKRHFGSVPAVDGVDLTVREGEIYGFLGVNGAGKTTTIRLLMGIIAAEAGSIALMGEVSPRTTVRQKRPIGYVSQEQHFCPWMTCSQLGRFVGSMYPTWDAAEFVRLLSVFEIPAKRKVSQLSGGMKAKLALAPRPDLLVLDEPTAGLDPVARREFMQTIVAQARQHRRTTFSRRISSMKWSDARIAWAFCTRGALQWSRGPRRRSMQSNARETCQPSKGHVIDSRA